MKRSISILLLIAMLVSLNACGSSNTETQTNETPSSAQETEPQETAPEKLMPDIPDTRYDGAEFRFLSREVIDANVRYYSEICSHEMNGELMNDETFNRTARLESTYDIKFLSDTKPMGEIEQTVQNSYNAGEQNWDVIVPGYSSAQNLAASGYNADLNQIPYIDTTKPWWDSASAETMKIGGSLYFAIGAMNTWTDSHSFGITFNKEMATKYDVAPYDMVRNNTWTLDNFYEIAEKVTNDVDGNGIMDETDQYGIVGENFNFTLHMLASDVFVVTNNEDGYPTLNITERFYTVADKICSIMSSNNYLRAEEYSNKYADAWTDALRANFRSGKSLFHVGALCEIILYRDLDIDIGLLPFPKYDEAQKTYRHSFSNYWSSVIMIPKNTSTAEFTGHMLEALQAESYYSTAEAYYDVMMGGKVVRDEDSREMLNIIRSTRTIDPELAYNFLGVNSMYANILKDKSAGSLASSVQSASKIAERYIQKFVKQYSE
ncbi:MAG: extracellular solute-binding protein [Clostridia bacterium]|nr:extracellular solute-binding protein [Clostridia bacterium]